MEMSGERLLPAGRQAVWAALNDPAVLQASIPGCKSLVASGENAFRASAAVRIGPIAAQFSGDVKLLDLVPAESYRIEGSGQGGPAGFARGGATVRLEPAGRETLLRYAVKAEVGGKLAQLGARLIDATAKQMADQFFDNFAHAVAAAEKATEVPAMAAPAPAKLSVMDMLPQDFLGYPPIAWLAALVFLFILFNLFASSM